MPELDPLDSPVARLLGVTPYEFEEIQLDFLEKIERDRDLFGFR